MRKTGLNGQAKKNINKLISFFGFYKTKSTFAAALNEKRIKKPAR